MFSGHIQAEKAQIILRNCPQSESFKKFNPDEVKDEFYDDLDSVISDTPRTDKIILLGDFNARVGTDHQTWEGVIWTEGIGKFNSNGLVLLKKCAEHELLITNTDFRLPTRNKRRHGCIFSPNTGTH